MKNNKPVGVIFAVSLLYLDAGTGISLTDLVQLKTEFLCLIPQTGTVNQL